MAAPTDPLRLRPARAAEAERLSAIARSAKAWWGYPADWLAGWRDELTVTPADIARDGYVVAETGDEIVGFAALGSGADPPEIEHLWVAPRHLGRGVGRRLLAAILARCRTDGVTRLRVVSDPHAVGFYRRHGAVTLGDVPSTPPPRGLPLLEFRLGPDGAEPQDRGAAR